MKKPRKIKRPRRRNAAASALADPRFRPRVVAARKGKRPYVRARVRRAVRRDLQEDV